MIQSWLLDYLLNSIWQLPLLYAAAALAGRVIAPLGSRALHRLWVVTLGFQIVLPGCNIAVASVLPSLLRWIFFAHSGQTTVRLSEGPWNVATGTAGLRGTIGGWALAAYAGVTAYLAARFLWRLFRTQQLARCAQPIDSEALPLALSSGIRGPVTVGIRRGLLLVPPEFLESVTPAEMEAVLAHEAAHMRRSDYLKNLVYQAISLPVAYHPACWLTRSRITETREMVCDEMAAASLPASGPQYARTLLRLATVLFRPNPAANHHAIGILDANIFERRIMNLTQPRTPAHPARRIATLAACGLIALATTASALALRVNLAAPTLRQDWGKPKISAGIMAGQVLLRKNPVYPAEAKANHDTVDGSVVLSAVIGKDGSIESLKVLKSLRPDYDTSALEAVKDWKYAPYLLNGQPTAVETTITVTYSADHSKD